MPEGIAYIKIAIFVFCAIFILHPHRTGCFHRILFLHLFFRSFLLRSFNPPVGIYILNLDTIVTMQLSAIQALLVALLVSGSLAAPVAVGAEVGNFAPELAERHHTEAQIAAKEKAKEAKEKHSRDVPAPDEFGPWDSTEDEFGSWVTPREVEAREAHHTEAQIAAKEAKAKKEGKKSA